MIGLAWLVEHVRSTGKHEANKEHRYTRFD